jgi:Ca2+-binding EF-hand superfamily protein
LSKELDLIRATNPVRLELDDSKSFSVENAFKAIDTANKGIITYANVEAFMQKNDIYLSNSEILSLFRRTNKS